ARPPGPRTAAPREPRRRPARLRGRGRGRCWRRSRGNPSGSLLPMTGVTLLDVHRASWLYASSSDFIAGKNSFWFVKRSRGGAFEGLLGGGVLSSEEPEERQGRGDGGADARHQEGLAVGGAQRLEREQLQALRHRH